LILLAALILGLLIGWGAARWRGLPYRAPELRHIWLIPAAALPQVVAVYWPQAADLAGVLLPLSLAVFLVFVWLNRRLPGMLVLLIGLVLNLAVMAANGGWMPLSPETASHLPRGKPPETAAVGTRVDEKSILLRPEDTRLEFLADRYLLPELLGYRAAISLGDVFIAAGAFWLLARPPYGPHPMRSENA
jgi:uncharacterized protein DUF5317